MNEWSQADDAKVRALSRADRRPSGQCCIVGMWASILGFL